MGSGLLETAAPQTTPVTRLPLEKLWDDKGFVDARKERVLTASDIHGFLLRDKPRRFVVARHGYPLLWVDLSDSFTFWTSQVRLHLYDAGRPNTDDYPNSYYYAAYEWRLADDEPIIVLERHP